MPAISVTSNAIPRAIDWIISCWFIRLVTPKTVEPLRQGLCAQDEGEHSEVQNEAGENNHPHCNLGGKQLVNKYSLNTSHYMSSETALDIEVGVHSQMVPDCQ
jgi:hypothetical protein